MACNSVENPKWIVQISAKHLSFSRKNWPWHLKKKKRVYVGNLALKILKLIMHITKEVQRLDKKMSELIKPEI